MKFSKIISAFAAVTMLLANLVTVNAAEAVTTTFNESEGIEVITSLPTREDVKLRTPSVSLSVADEPFETKAKLRTATNATFANNFDLADFYQVTATFSNLGILANGFDNDINRVYVGLANMTVKLDSEGILYSGTKTAQLDDSGEMSCGIKQGTTMTTANYIASSTNPYPYYDEENFVDSVVDESNDPVAVTFVVGIEKGGSVTVPASKMSSFVMYATTGSKTDDIDIAITEDLVIGKATAAEPNAVITKVNLAEGTMGAAWDVTIENYDSEKDYVATFTAEDAKPEEAKPAIPLTSLDTVAETDGNISFAVLLKLTKARTGLTLGIEIK